MTPRSEALAFRVWAYASPRGWSCTVTEIADDLGVSYHRVRAVCQHKGWLQRLAGTSRPVHGFADASGGDGFLLDRRGAIEALADVADMAGAEE